MWRRFFKWGRAVLIATRRRWAARVLKSLGDPPGRWTLSGRVAFAVFMGLWRWKRPRDSLGAARRAFVFRLRAWCQEPGSGADRLYALYQRNSRIAPVEAAWMTGRIEQWPGRPTIAILVAVHDAKPEWIRRLVQSVTAQLYDRWELVLVDDASPSGATRQSLAHWAKVDERIRVIFSEVHLGVCAALNRAANSTRHDFLAFVDHDDELSPDALWCVAERLEQEPAADVLSSDEEIVPTDGRPAYSIAKPLTLSPEKLLSHNYLCHLLVMRRTVFEQLGGFRAGTEGAQDYDLVLRALRQERCFSHIPRVLYRWHQTPESLSRRPDPRTGGAGPQPGIEAVTRRVLAEHYQAIHLPADVGWDGQWAYPNWNSIESAKVSIIIPTGPRTDLLEDCVASIERHTSDPKWEICIITSDGRSPPNERRLARIAARHRVIHLDSTRSDAVTAAQVPFSFARACNAAAGATTGETLLFLNDDTLATTPGWLRALVGVLQIEAVGAAGARLLFPNGRLQHAGILKGARGWGPWHARYQERPGDPRFRDIEAAIRNVVAVTGACLATRRETFESLGGFDEHFPMNFSDVDFCLRVQKAGKRVAYVPEATLIHRESQSRHAGVTSFEAERLRKRWAGVIDPYWSPLQRHSAPDLLPRSRRQRRGFIDGPVRVLLTGHDDNRLTRQLRELADCQKVSVDRLENDSSASLLARGDVLVAVGWQSAWAIQAASRLASDGQVAIPSIWYLPIESFIDTVDAVATWAKRAELLDLPYQVLMDDPRLLRDLEGGRCQPNASLWDSEASAAEEAWLRAELESLLFEAAELAPWTARIWPPSHAPAVARHAGDSV